MTVTTEGLVTLAAALLAQPSTTTPPTYPTNAGPRVYAPQDWPTHDGMYPAIFLSGPRERKESLGNAGAPEFRVTGTIRVAARDSSGAASDDGSAGPLLASLSALQRQIETGLINNPALMGQLEKFGEISTEMAFKASGEKHLGEVEVNLDVVFYQGPEDFFDVVGVPLTGVTLTTQYPTPSGPNVGLNITIPQ